MSLSISEEEKAEIIKLKSTPDQLKKSKTQRENEKHAKNYVNRTLKELEDLRNRNRQNQDKNKLLIKNFMGSLKF